MATFLYVLGSIYAFFTAVQFIFIASGQSAAYGVVDKYLISMVICYGFAKLIAQGESKAKPKGD
ncbi:MAG TPA: hypothetical protein ENJ90_11275 [Devosia sp.]|nr:hypothetical protein [Devosia sp.]